MDHPPTIREVTVLYEELDPDQRDELLQALLIAATIGWDHLRDVLEAFLLAAGVKRDLRRL